ncbi:hypothetical protein CEXT_193521 [Caerostris extrusa]|uniref:Uncharacterized protein n=1 Tax=Caerostris extrusa TaxID=172846 RepID=A0AAV4UE42_CAEEX|nr:hypothetical protein CEXT_193521 [Caerostris extrusa]
MSYLSSERDSQASRRFSQLLILKFLRNLLKKLLTIVRKMAISWSMDVMDVKSGGSAFVDILFRAKAGDIASIKNKYPDLYLRYKTNILSSYSEVNLS